MRPFLTSFLRFLSFVFCLFFCTFVFSEVQSKTYSLPQGCSVGFSLNASRLSLSQHLVVSLELVYPKTHRVDVSKLKENLLKGHFSALSISEDIQETLLEQGSVQRHHITFFLKAWHPGKYFISFLEVSFYPKTANQEVLMAFCDVLDVFFENPPEKDRDIGALQVNLVPLKSVQSLSVSSEHHKELIDQLGKSMESHSGETFFKQTTQYYWWLLVGIVVVLLTFLSKKYLFFHKNPPIKEVQIDPKKQAQEKLEALHKKDYPSQGHYELFYMEVTQVVRTFIEQKYGIQAIESTTEEFLQHVLHLHLFCPQTRTLLSDFLQTADLVKFAKLNPSLRDCQKTFELAQRFVFLR